MLKVADLKVDCNICMSLRQKQIHHSIWFHCSVLAQLFVQAFLYNQKGMSNHFVMQPSAKLSRHTIIKSKQATTWSALRLTTCSSLISHTRTHKNVNRTNCNYSKNKYGELRICNHIRTGSNMIVQFASSTIVQWVYEPGTNILIYRTSQR